MTKDFVTQMQRDIVNLSVDIHGAYGTVEDYPIARMYREAAVMPQVEGPPHIQKVILASALMAEYK
jgi:acyl-CoA dehydrogenase